MQLKTKYILFVTLVHLIMQVLLYFLFAKNKLVLIILEVFAIFSVVLAWNLYRQLIQPLKMLMQGTETIKDKDFNVKFRPTGNYEMDRLIDVFNNMMDELRSERTKQEQQHYFLDKLIYTSPVGIIILDYDNNIQQINKKAAQFLGMNPSQPLPAVLNETSHLMLDQAGSLRSGETTIVKLDGVNTYKMQKSHFVDRGSSRHFIMIEELTTEMLAAEKKVYDKVIRMMAHEVNNTIGPVNSIMQSALKMETLWEGHDFGTLKDALQVAIDRNRNLSFFMRNFAELVKLPAPNKQQFDLHKLIHSVMIFMGSRAEGKGVEFKLQLAEGPFFISADEQQIEHALINIIKNAIEAIDDTGYVVVITEPALKRLVIADTGRGIVAAQAANLFSPFFSTKRDGQGIGLTLVREIFLNHGYEFSLKTVVKGRTEFSITLD